jgi:hypothetical protein
MFPAFDNHGVLSYLCAKPFDVLVQGVSKFNDYRPGFFLVFGDKELGAQDADSIFHSTHGRSASTMHGRNNTVRGKSGRCNTVLTPEGVSPS